MTAASDPEPIPSSAPLVILFPTGQAANVPVAAIPAAARAMHTLAMLDCPAHAGIIVAVPGGWTPSKLCCAEVERLTGQNAMPALDADMCDSVAWISGADLQHPASGIETLIHRHQDAVPTFSLDDLHARSAAIIRATAKPGDGIVSRKCNRPISQALTRIALRLPAARPIHATLACGLVALVMLAALVLGGAAGLIAGAVLFQIASIVDGVDGEMARATFRSSASGAKWDSITDVCTNFGFLAGVSYNLYASGQHGAAVAGASACVMLATGSLILARQSTRDGGDFTFNALKNRISRRGSVVRQWLIWVTMRDFYALLSCIVIIAGGAAMLLYLFACVTLFWLAVMIAALFGPRKHTP